jgi:phage terminase large subunit-like protein
LDEWEQSQDYIFQHPEVWKKVNPHIGITVQRDYYQMEIEKSRIDGPDKDVEVLSKLFNTFQTGKVREWLSPDDIRPLQIDRRIDDCKYDEGWIVFCGLDFSKGDDLNGVSYLAYNTERGEFFADMDSYMSEAAVNASPIRELLLKWAEKGYLHIVPGQTFDPSWPVNRIIELDGKGVNFMGFGYDPYNAKVVMNALSQWVFEIGLDVKQMIRPVRQNFATYNPAVGEFDYMVKRSVDDGAGHQVPDPLIHFSMNSLWPWEFGNVMLQESGDGMENLKPVKRNVNGKVDNIQMLLSALILYDEAEGRVES